ncbi:hypothetical protein SAMN06272781_0003 [Streptomyces sp. 1222.2]|uniref:hypothetical protein n=1 Tax=Streptomyces sp. 1222.2 TaxID=1938833 RepID=UPI000BC9697D|nr:hypothetical protein [Streptomyces sp. 1222.2]SOD65133.1 hypothetical protein SAMN06272781_0003 [Streptomyces sp. 1222.2]
MSVVRERLATLCDQVAGHREMRQAISDAGAGPQLTELLDAVTAEQTPDQDRLLVLLDEIEDACSRDGLAGITTSSKQYTSLPAGFQVTGLDEPVTWTCPLRRCNRTVFDDEASAPPSCAAAGTQMTAIRIL